MRTDVPETPEFWNRLETELRSHPPRPRRHDFGVPVTVMRTLRTFTRHAVHMSAVVALAVAMVMGSSRPMGDTARVSIASDPQVPAYVAQYGGASTAESAVAQARSNGYEVAVRRIFTPDPSEDGRIVDQFHPGSDTATQARGPILFVIGFTIGQGDRTAD